LQDPDDFGFGSEFLDMSPKVQSEKELISWVSLKFSAVGKTPSRT
jgi:hypothetical protein